MIDDLKFSLRNILMIFFPIEVKEAYGIIYEIERELNDKYGMLSYPAMVWPTIRFRIEKYLIVKTKAYINFMRDKKLSPREIVYSITYNESSTEIEIADPYTSATKGYEMLNKYITNKINKMKGLV